MSRYSKTESSIFGIFDSAAWKGENVKTFPSNFVQINAGNEFIRLSVLTTDKGLNINSVAGLLIADIFIPAGNGPRRATLIADLLDKHLLGKTVDTGGGSSTQFTTSTLVSRGTDKDNPSLHMSSYSIPFNFFGVI